MYNILLLGETGSGKSTLINYLTNHFKSGNLSNLSISIRTKFHEATEGLENSEKDFIDLKKSQTIKCTTYNFEKNGLNFNFIDTPGLSDTDGPAKDDDHVQNIMKAAAEIEFLVAIIIVINGVQARATPTVRNTLCLLKNTVPDMFLDNLVVVFTNCSEFTVRFDLEQLKPWTIRPENVFHMDNSAFCKPADSWIANVRQNRMLEYQWEESMEEIGRMIQILKQHGKKATIDFEKMLRKRWEIFVHLHEILFKIRRYQDAQNEIENYQREHSDTCNSVKHYSEMIQSKEIECGEIESRCSSRSKELLGFTALWCGITVVTGVATGGVGFLAGTIGLAASAVTGTVLNYRDKRRKIRLEEIICEAKEDIRRSVKSQNKVQQKIESSENHIAILKTALDAVYEKFKKCCEDLRKLCSLFNFVHALNQIIEDMEEEVRAVSSEKTKADAQKRIIEIKRFIENFSRLS